MTHDNKKKQKILKLCTAARLAHTLTLFMEAVLYGRLFIGNLEEIKLNLLNRTKVILKQRLHFKISPKKSSLGGKIILWQPPKV